MSAGNGGHGPPPKDPDRKARGGLTNRQAALPLRLVVVEPTKQPELPEFDIQITRNAELVSQRFVWPERTRIWWKMWGESKLSATFTDNDWSELLDTAFLHARFWTGHTQVAGELRLRAAKFGATPEDRARLRIQCVTAEDLESKQEARQNTPSSRGRYESPGQSA